MAHLEKHKLLPFHTPGMVEAGLDEVGRGCLAGPVVAAAVILPPSFDLPLLNDSKKMTKENRLACEEIIRKEAITFAIAEVDPATIDEINILNASFLAMHRSVDALAVVPEHLLVDGNRFKPYRQIPHTCIIKGDGKYAAIAAASVLAKNYRDNLMENLAKQHPGYGWETNVGYPTLAHRHAIRKLGTTPWHRLSFQLLPSQLELFVDS